MRVRMLILVLLLAAYRSPVAVLIGMVPVLSGALVGIAAVAVGFGVVYGVTLGFGVTLIGESVDYPIYYLVQSRGAGQLRTADEAQVAVEIARSSRRLAAKAEARV